MKSSIIKKVIIISLCLLFIGGVITVTLLTRQKENGEDSDPIQGNLSDYLDEAINKDFALFDLGSTNCEPCKKLQPVLEELKEKYDTIDIRFYNITSTSAGANVANYYKVNVMPTLLFLDGSGKELRRVVGFHSVEQIETIFRELGWI